MPLVHAITTKLLIYVYADEHAPTHFHVNSPDGNAEVWLDTLSVKANSGVPEKALRKAIEWASIDANNVIIRNRFNQLNPEIAK